MPDSREKLQLLHWRSVHSGGIINLTGGFGRRCTTVQTKSNETSLDSSHHLSKLQKAAMAQCLRPLLC